MPDIIPDITYVKHSLRQVHKACAGCGTDKLYWAHEQIGKPNPDDFGWCGACQASGALVMVDMDTMKPHSCIPSLGSADPENDEGGDSTHGEEDEGQPSSDLGDADPWKANADESDANEIAEKLAEISVGNDLDTAKAEEEMAGVIEGIQISGSSTANAQSENSQGEAGEDEEQPPPFPDDDEYVTHRELNEFDPVSRPEVTEAFDSVRDGMDKIHNMHMRQGGRIAQLSTQMIELERRTRITITINDVAAGTTYDLPDDLHHCQLADVIKILSVDNCLMVGPAGSGKGEIAYQAADALKLDFYTLDQGSLSPQTPVSSIIGYMNSAGKYIGTTFYKAFKDGGLIFFDELDNAHPACLATINAAISVRPGQAIGFPGGRMIKRHENFRVLAAANTFGRGPDRTYAARQRGDAATWDRFSILHLKYDHTLEDVLCARTGIDQETMIRVLRYVRKLRSNIETHQGTIPAVIGMRGSEKMCALLKAGLDAETAIFARCRRGMSDQDWAKISNGATFKTVAESPPPTPLDILNMPNPFSSAASFSDDFTVSGTLQTAGNNLIGNFYISETGIDGTQTVTHVNVNPQIVLLIAKDKKVVAIKELRNAYRKLSMKQCKAIVGMAAAEYARKWQNGGITVSARPEYLG